MVNSKRKGVMSKRMASIMREVYPSKRLGVGNDRYTNGVGYVILPNDVGRDDYIKFTYQTATVMVITNTGELISDMIVPEHILKSIKFPQSLDERGSLLSWNNIPLLNQTVATGIIRSTENTYPYGEGEVVDEIGGGGYGNVISRTWDINNSYARLEAYFGDSDALSRDSGIEHTARSPRWQSKIKLLCNGRALLYGDNESKLLSEEEVRLEVGTQEGEVSSLVMDVDGTFNYEDRHGNRVSIDGSSGDMTIKTNRALTIDAEENINIGESATQSAMLGERTTGIIREILNAIKTITVPTALGSSGTPINFAVFDQIESRLNTTLSELVKIE